MPSVPEMSHCEHERGVVCFASFHVGVHFSGNRKNCERNTEGTTGRFTHATDTWLFYFYEPRIEQKSRRLTTGWVTSLHCIDSGWVAPYLLLFLFFLFLDVAVDKMCENVSVQSWGCSVKTVMWADLVDVYRPSASRECYIYWQIYEFSRHALQLANGKWGKQVIELFKLIFLNLFFSLTLIDSELWYEKR